MNLWGYVENDNEFQAELGVVRMEGKEKYDKREDPCCVLNMKQRRCVTVKWCDMANLEHTKESRTQLHICPTARILNIVILCLTA